MEVKRTAALWRCTGLLLDGDAGGICHMESSINGQ